MTHAPFRERAIANLTHAIEHAVTIDASLIMSSRLSLLIDLAALLSREVDFDSLLLTACERLAHALEAERVTIWLVDAERGDLFTRVAVLPELPELRQPMDRGIAAYVARTGDVVRIDDAAKDERFDPTADRATGYTTRSMLVAPIREAKESPVRGVVQVLNRRGGAWDDTDGPYLETLATQMARALALTTLRAAEPKVPGVTLRGPFNHIVGTSAAIATVYERISLAAASDASVLLRGETGTGKGIFARAIHVNSLRQAGPFVTVDCTTLPAQLVESELFGHERGAFTGADRRVPGKIELAENGTLFLDEIGDMPIDMQGKLLRFLQERAFARVGGREELHANVRVVCATHQNLEARLKEKRFREDLYYRIRVVEIELPTLRSRGKDEIESLARHFADVYAKRYERNAPRFDDDTLRAIREYAWPGNVRELEHWIESAIVLSRDGVIRAASPLDRNAHVAPSTLNSAESAAILPLGLTLEEASRRYVQATLDNAGGNKAEAARRLGVTRNTIARTLK
jgi:DNA-binding NtrC family response regulator